MASDPGLAAMLLWTISLQALGTAGSNSNEGKCVCVCVFSYSGDVRHEELLINTATTREKRVTHVRKRVRFRVTTPGLGIKVCSAEQLQETCVMRVHVCVCVNSF